MEQFSQLSAAFEQQLVPSTAKPGQRQAESGDGRLEISVVFTSAEAASAALRKAALLAGNLSARITLIVPQVVPFPLPLSSPPVLLDFREERLREIATSCVLETLVRIYLCRDRWDILKAVLTPNSLIVLGRRSGWWRFNNEQRLARRLRKAGHEVVVAEAE